MLVTFLLKLQIQTFYYPLKRTKESNKYGQNPFRNTNTMGMIKLLGILLVLFAYTVIPQTAEGPCRGCKNCQDCGDSCKNCTNCRQYFTITRTCTIAMVIGAGVGGPFIPFILGFGGASVTAGSLAALWQSTMGGVVVKGGIISFLQAIGAAG